ncbi:MAG TPA: MurR/RpiR family transcriptional regulator [Patescibacteria group bacterium]|nr:MurR/RpiR family transcriptional regulator [Patescibacteria group bacterium]
MLFSEIRLQSNRFTATQNKIVQYLQEHAQEALTLPINEFAAQCGVGDATVIRFYRQLGYKNYAMFRVALAKELHEADARPIYEEVAENDGLSDVIRKVIDSTTQGIADLEKQLSTDALEKIAENLRCASVIHVIGLGASGVVALDARHKFMRLGCKIIDYSDSHLMTIAASIARSDEVFLAISHSGETTDILRTLELAKKRGCFTCALTSSIDSSITRLVDAYLLSCTCETKMRSDAMISRIVQLVVIDILYVMLALQIGEPAMEGVHQSRLALRQYRNQST